MPAPQTRLGRVFTEKGNLVRLPEGRLLQFRGELSERLYYLVKGQVVLHLSSRLGKELTIDVFGPGELIGIGALSAEAVHYLNATTLSECLLRSLSAQVLKSELTRDAKLCLELFNSQPPRGGVHAASSRHDHRKELTMLKKVLLAAAAAVAVTAAASAQTMDGFDLPANNGVNKKYAFECVVTKVTPTDKEKDPGYKVNVTINYDGRFAEVVHTTRSGAVYDRAEQYMVQVNEPYNSNGPNAWYGNSKKHPSVKMLGMFSVFKDGRMTYRELVFKDGVKQPVTTVDTACHRIQA
jgi:CRP-like cAMP-binding protein